jgi:Sugar (and other) transporter
VVDKRGRRPIIFYVTLSLSLMWVIIVTTTAVFKQSGDTNSPAANASIAFIYIFRMVYSFGFTPMQALYPVECLKFEVNPHPPICTESNKQARAKGMAMLQFFINVANFVNQYALAVALDVRSNFGSG